MRTKSLLLAAAISVAGALSSSAQSTNVYSVNAVGYVNVEIPNGFSMIANPLFGSNNSVSNLFKSVPDQTVIYIYNTASSTYIGNPFEFGAWANPTQTLTPGQGFFIFNPSLKYTNSFVGDVPQGSLTNNLANGFTLTASQVPQAGGIQSLLGFVPGEGDTVYQFNGATYASRSFEFGSWGGGIEPSLKVAEGIFLFNASGSPKKWIRAFTANN